jgi:hypothetical protein
MVSPHYGGYTRLGQNKGKRIPARAGRAGRRRSAARVDALRLRRQEKLALGDAVLQNRLACCKFARSQTGIGFIPELTFR